MAKHQGDDGKDSKTPEDQRLKDKLVKHLEGLAEEVAPSEEQETEIRDIPQKYPLSRPLPSARERIRKSRETETEREK